MGDIENLLNTIGGSFIGALSLSMNNSTIQMFNCIAPALKENIKHVSIGDSSLPDRIRGIGLMLGKNKADSIRNKELKKKIVKIRRWKNAEKRDSFENIVKLYSDSDFKIHFRMNRVSTEIVIQLVGPYVKEGSRRPAIKCQKMVLLALWILGNQESFRLVSERFKMGKGHAHRVFLTFCSILCKRAHEIILWPKGEEAVETVVNFNQLRIHSFPNVIGCVGTTHIPIRSPEKVSDNFNNSFGYHSTILQGICDSESRFRDVFCGWPGSSTSAHVWRNSPIQVELKGKIDTIPMDCHLLGNSAYPLDSFLMVPFADDGCLSDLEQNFNDELMATWVVIQHAFAILKGRFRRLRFLDMTLIQKISSVILAACILHNICIDNKDVTLEREEETLQDSDTEQEVSENGVEKRDKVASFMFEESGNDDDCYF